jgi:branched-chain amino acid transport system substrate-binding protein
VVAVGTAVGILASVGFVSTPAGAAPKAKPVLLGVVYSGTGTDSSSSAPLAVGVEAWAKWVNAHGGITGRQVKLMLENDQSDSTTTLTDTRDIISAGAAGIVIATGLQSVITSTINSAKIPAIGGIMDGLTWGTDPNYFASGTTPIDYAASATDLGLPKYKHLAVFYCAASASCSLTLPLFKLGITQAGGTYTGAFSISATAATFTAQCLAAKAAGTDAILFNVTAATPVRIAPSCASQGFKPQYVTTATIVANDWLKVPALNGTLITYQNAPYYGSPKSFPGLATFNAAMKKYEKSYLKNPNFGQVTLTGWGSGLLFQAALKASKVPANKTVTKTDVFAGLYKLKGVTLNGLSGPITFTKSGKYHFTCYFSGKISKGKLVQTKATPTCAKPITL